MISTEAPEIEMGSLRGGLAQDSRSAASSASGQTVAINRARSAGRGIVTPAVCGKCHKKARLSQREEDPMLHETCYRCGKDEKGGTLERWECAYRCKFALHHDCQQVELHTSTRPRHLKQSLECSAEDRSTTLTYQLAAGGLVLPFLGALYLFTGRDPNPNADSNLANANFENAPSYLLLAVGWFGFLAALSHYISRLPRPRWHTFASMGPCLNRVAPWSPIVCLVLLLTLVCYCIHGVAFFKSAGIAISWSMAFSFLVVWALRLVSADPVLLYDMILVPGYFALVAPIVPAVYVLAINWSHIPQQTDYRDLLVRMVVAAIFGPIAVTCYWTMRRPSKHGWHTDPEHYVLHGQEELEVRQPLAKQEQHISQCVAFEMVEMEAECHFCHGTEFIKMPDDSHHDCKQCVGCHKSRAKYQCEDERCDYHLCEEHHNLRLAMAEPSFELREEFRDIHMEGEPWPTLWRWRRTATLLVHCAQCQGALKGKLNPKGGCKWCDSEETAFACTKCDWHLCEKCAQRDRAASGVTKQIRRLYRMARALFRKHDYLYVFAQESLQEEYGTYGQLFRCRIFSGWIGVWHMVFDAVFEGAFTYVVLYLSSLRFYNSAHPCQTPVYDPVVCEMPCVNRLSWLPPHNNFSYYNASGVPQWTGVQGWQCLRYPQIVDLGMLFQSVSLGIMLITSFTGFYNLYLLMESFAGLTDSVNIFLWQFDPGCVDETALHSTGPQVDLERQRGGQEKAPSATATTQRVLRVPTPVELDRQKVAQKVFLRHMIKIRSGMRQTEQDGLLVEYYLDWLPMVPSRKQVERMRKKMESPEAELEQDHNGEEEITWEWWFRYQKALLETVDFYYWRVWWVLIGLLILWLSFMVNIILSAGVSAYQTTLTKDFAAIAYAMALYGLPVLVGVVLGAWLNQAMDESLETIEKFVQTVEDKQYLEWARRHPQKLQMCFWEMNLNMVLTAAASIFSGVCLLAFSSN